MGIPHLPDLQRSTSCVQARSESLGASAPVGGHSHSPRSRSTEMQILQATSHKQRAAIRRPIFPGARPHAPRVSPVGEVEFSDTIGSHRLDQQRLIFAGK